MGIFLNFNLFGEVPFWISTNLMFALYKTPETTCTSFSSNSTDNRITSTEKKFENIKNELSQKIEFFLSSLERKEYDQLERTIEVFIKVFRQKKLEIYEIVSPYPMIPSLVAASQIPQFTGISFQCISELITLQPEVYQQQILQIPNFVDYLFNELNDEESLNRYSCALIITNITEAFQKNSQQFISYLNFNSLNDFVLEGYEYSKVCLRLMTKIVEFIEVSNNIIIEFIKISKIIFDLYIQSHREIIINIMEFYNKLIEIQFLAVSPLLDLKMIDQIFNFISIDDDNIIYNDQNYRTNKMCSNNLILYAISYYLIVIDKGINNKKYFGISQQIIKEASIPEIISWIKYLDTEACKPGYHLLALLLKYQEIFQIDVIDEINQTCIVACAITSITECRFKQKMKLLDFIIIYIEKSDGTFITNDQNYDMFFALFDHLLSQSFDLSDLLEIINLFWDYLTKMSLKRKNEMHNILAVAMKKYTFIDCLNQMVFDEEYKKDDVIIGKITCILKLFPSENEDNQ